MGSQALLHNSKLHSLVRVTTDDSSRKTLVSKSSLGRMKHIQTCYLWIQGQLALKHFVLAIVGTLLNRADVFTKPLSASFMH